MLRLIRASALLAAILLSRAVVAADAGALDGVAKQPAEPAAAGQAGKASPPTADAERPDRWRYRWHNGRWWYWTKSSRWLVWNEGQGWVLHEQPAAPVVTAPAVQAPATRRPADDSWRWGWDPANPFDRHPPGRPMNSPKVFPRNM